MLDGLEDKIDWIFNTKSGELQIAFREIDNLGELFFEDLEEFLSELGLCLEKGTRSRDVCHIQLSDEYKKETEQIKNWLISNL